MRFAINILGPLEVKEAGEPIDVTRRQVRLVLAVLAGSASEWVPGSVLEAELWPDAAVKSPTAALRTVISRTRALFGSAGAEVVVSSADSYRLDSDICAVDLRVWEELVERARRQVRDDHPVRAEQDFVEARRLWRGDPFGMVATSSLLDRERTRIDQLRGDVDIEDARVRSLTGDLAEAVRILSRALAREPFREDLAIASLECMMVAGRRPEALRSAARFRELIREELGASPSSKFDRTERAVLSSGPAVRAKPRPTPWIWRRGLVERTAQALITAQAQQRGAVLRVGAPAGFGLSTFIANVADAVRRAAPLVAVESLRQEAGREHSVRAVLGGTVVALGDDIYRQHTLLVDRITALAEGDGLILVIDDADRLDALSSRLVGRFELWGPPNGVAVLVASHTFDTADCDVELGGLDRVDVQGLLTEVVPGLTTAAAHRTAVRLCDWCGGDPAWTRDAAALLAAEGDAAPLPIHRDTGVRIAHQLADLDPDTRDLLVTAAVLDEKIDANLLAAVRSEVSGDVGSANDVATAIARLGLAVAREVIRKSATPGRWVFVDGPTRQALRADVDLDTAKHIHRAAGRWLAAHGTGAARLARHLMEALPFGQSDVAAVAAIEGGRELLAEARYAEAADLFAGAASLAPTVQGGDGARVLHASARECLGDHDRANEIYDDVITRVASNDSDLLADVALGGSGRSSRIGGQPKRRRRLGIAYRHLDPHHPRADEVAAEYGLELMIARMPLDADLRRRLEAAASGEASAGHLLARRVLVVDDESTEGAAFADAEALANMALRHDLRGRALYSGASLAVAIQIALVTGEWERAEGWIDELELVGLTSGEPRSRWQAAAYRASLSEARGAAAEANELAAHAIDVGRRLDIADAELTAEIHDLGRLLRHGSIAQTLVRLQAVAGFLQYPVWHALRGLAELDSGNEGAARQTLDEWATSLDDDKPDTFRPPALALGCVLGARLDEMDRVATLTSSLEHRDGGMVFLGYGGPFLGPVDWFLAVRDHALGNGPSASAHLDLAVASAARAGASWRPPAWPTNH